MKRKDLERIKDIVESLARAVKDVDGSVVPTVKNYIYECVTPDEQLAVRVRNVVDELRWLHDDVRLALEQIPSVKVFNAGAGEHEQWGYLVSLIDVNDDELLTMWFNDFDKACSYAREEIEDGTCLRATVEVATKKLAAEIRLE